MTVPISLYVSRSLSRSGCTLVMPAASWPRFCRSSSIRGIRRETSSGSPVQTGGLLGVARQVVEGRDAALVLQLVHVTAGWERRGTRVPTGEDTTRNGSRKARRPSRSIPENA